MRVREVLEDSRTVNNSLDKIMFIQLLPSKHMSERAEKNSRVLSNNEQCDRQPLQDVVCELTQFYLFCDSGFKKKLISFKQLESSIQFLWKNFNIFFYTFITYVWKLLWNNCKVISSI